VRFNVDIAIVSKRDIDPGPFQTIATNLAVSLSSAPRAITAGVPNEDALEWARI